MSLTLNDIKAYLRITHNVDDTFLESLVGTSKAFIKEETGVEFVAGDKVYEQCVLFLVAHLYDNRASVTEKATTEIPYTLDALLRHIKIRGAVEVAPVENETPVANETPTQTQEGANDDE